MLDRLQEHFLGEPRRLISLGVTLTRAGGFLLVAGLAGSAATNAIKLSEPDIMTSRINSQPKSPRVNDMENFSKSVPASLKTSGICCVLLNLLQHTVSALLTSPANAV